VNKHKRLTVLRDAWEGCTRCALSDGRKTDRIAFGRGHTDAPILLVTEYPTQEDTLVGTALASYEESNLFDTLLELAGLERKKVFVTSLVSCFPFYVIPETEDEEARIMPRAPTKEEFTACLPRLYETIYIVDPYLIIVMGEETWKTLVPPRNRGKHKTLNAAIGKLFVAPVPGVTRELQYPVLAAPSLRRIRIDPSAAKHGPPAVLHRCLVDARENVEAQLKLQEEST
jgi:uracil-DNA glycosylase family 4